MASYLTTYQVNTWTPLTLLNGWLAKTGTGTILPPISWSQVGTVIQLRGEITPPNVLPGNLTIASLPAQARPPYEYVFPIEILGGADTGGIRVKQDGTISLEGVTGLSSLSLNGIHYTLST